MVCKPDFCFSCWSLFVFIFIFIFKIKFFYFYAKTRTNSVVKFYDCLNFNRKYKYAFISSIFYLNRTLIIQPLLKQLSLDHNPAPAIQDPFRTRIILYQTSHFLISNMEIYRCFLNCHKIFFIKCNA